MAGPRSRVGQEREVDKCGVGEGEFSPEQDLNTPIQREAIGGNVPEIKDQRNQHLIRQRRHLVA